MATIQSTLTDDQKKEIRDLIISTLVNYDDIMRVKSGQIESGNFIAGVQGWQLNSQGNLEANNGTFRGSISGSTINTDVITDVTYGFNGVFCKTFKRTDFGGAVYFDIAPNNGGLLNVTANWTSAAGNYLLLPGFNTTTVTEYYSSRVNGGNYQIWHAGSNIILDIPNVTAVYYTAFFNSLEAAGSFPA